MAYDVLPEPDEAGEARYAVDSFRVKYNRLPDSLRGAGVSESDPESVFIGSRK
jgi:hypothetical protein